MAPRRLPKKVLERAKAVTRPAEPEKRPTAEVRPRQPKAGEKVREKLKAHLRRLHPMD